MDEDVGGIETNCDILQQRALLDADSVRYLGLLFNARFERRHQARHRLHFALKAMQRSVVERNVQISLSLPKHGDSITQVVLQTSQAPLENIGFDSNDFTHSRCSRRARALVAIARHVRLHGQPQSFLNASLERREQRRINGPQPFSQPLQKVSQFSTA